MAAGDEDDAVRLACDELAALHVRLNLLGCGDLDVARACLGYATSLFVRLMGDSWFAVKLRRIARYHAQEAEAQMRALAIQSAIRDLDRLELRGRA